MGCWTNLGKGPSKGNRWKSKEEPMLERWQGCTRQDDNALAYNFIIFIGYDVIKILS